MAAALCIIQMSISEKVIYKKNKYFLQVGASCLTFHRRHIPTKPAFFLTQLWEVTIKASHLSPMIRPSTTLHINLQPSFLLFKVLGCGKGATTATVNPQNCIPPFFTPLIFKSQVRSVPLRSSFFLPVSPPVINETQEFFFQQNSFFFF